MISRTLGVLGVSHEERKEFLSLCRGEFLQRGGDMLQLLYRRIRVDDIVI